MSVFAEHRFHVNNPLHFWTGGLAPRSAPHLSFISLFPRHPLWNQSMPNNDPDPPVYILYKTYNFFFSMEIAQFNPSLHQMHCRGRAGFTTALPNKKSKRGPRLACPTCPNSSTPRGAVSLPNGHLHQPKHKIVSNAGKSIPTATNKTLTLLRQA